MQLELDLTITDPEPDTELGWQAQRRADRVEDLAWMAKTGESLEMAAERIGMTVNNLGKFLEREGRTDIRRQLRRNTGHLRQTESAA